MKQKDQETQIDILVKILSNNIKDDRVYVIGDNVDSY